MMPSFLYDAGPNGLWVFLLCTVVLGGAAAFVSGRAIAQTWRPLAQVPAYMLVLACVVRFFHFALFEEPLLSLRSYAVDYVILLVCAYVGYRSTRARQMETQYGWLREPPPPASAERP